MKQLLSIVVLLSGLLMAPQFANGQGFLKNLREKAESMIAPQNEQEKNESSATQAGHDEQKAPDRINPSDQVKKRVWATASWDDMITPSTATDPEALIAALPPLPTVEQLVNPDPDTRADYYRKIASVTMRLDELTIQYACSDEEIEAFVNAVYNSQAAKLGVTPEELKALDSGQLSSEEEEQIAQKIVNATVGDLSGIQAMAAAAETKKDKDGNISDADAIALMEQYGGQLNLDQLMSKSQEMTANQSRQTELIQRQREINEKMYPDGADALTRCENIARKYDKDLRDAYLLLCEQSGGEGTDAIYTRADDIVKNYRREAATVWLADLQKRLDAVKAGHADLKTLEADLLKEGLMIECMQRTSSLNIVSAYANLLDAAWREFPQPHILPVCRDILLELPKEEHLIHSESGFATSVSGFISGSEILVSNEQGERFVYEGGHKRRLTPDENNDFAGKREREKPQYGQWSSQNGERTVCYQNDGALILHDGTTFYPLAFEKNGNMLNWVSYIDNRIEQCTYQL